MKNRILILALLATSFAFAQRGGSITYEEVNDGTLHFLGRKYKQYTDKAGNVWKVGDQVEVLDPGNGLRAYQAIFYDAGSGMGVRTGTISEGTYVVRKIQMLGGQHYGFYILIQAMDKKTRKKLYIEVEDATTLKEARPLR